jgi:dipeptidyl aminopeptidase/acylaminoacyl peptidase
MQTANLRHTSLLSVAAIVALALPAHTQTRALTTDDYARAEKFLGYNTNGLVLHVAAQPTWVGDERFWYRTATENGTEFFLVDAATGARTAAFDQAKIAAALSTAGRSTYTAYRLPFNQFEFSTDRKSISFNAGGSQWTCDVGGARCESKERRTEPPSVVSPDGRRAAFIRSYNLWVRDMATGKETQLTRDGVKEFGYATDNAGWIHSDSPILLWSPDSKKIATFQMDERGTGDMYLVSTNVGHPRLEAWKYPLPGDSRIFMIERVVIDVDRARVVRLQMPPDPHRSSVCDDVECSGPFEDVEWSPDGRQVAFLSTSRDHKEAHLRVADTDSGRVRQVLEEKVATYYESGNDAHNWRFLPASNEVIWFSERDNWGQLYLYDLQTGRLKNQITTGEGNVTQLLRLDEKNRQLYFRGVGKEKGRDPYFIHFYRIGFDGKNLTLLTPEDATHVVAPSPSARYFLDSYSKPDVAPTAVLRDSDGKLVATLERADISRLVATGWKPPQPIVVKGRDGTTDLYGLLYKPTNLNAAAKYPIVNHIYPGPQTGSVGPRNFISARGDSQALAELGFVVVEIDGMGTPWRSKKFHDAYFGDMGDNTLPDQVAAMKDLAVQYPWIDLNRVGIWGHSGGGYATAGAMFHYPDFFKVGISESGNHDNRNYEDDWAEKWQGLLEKKADGTTNYDSQANQNVVKNLKGKLLLTHGTMDDNVPSSNTLLLVDELIKANKDFDLLLLPNRHHGYAAEPYMIRRRWDYFVRNLLGAEPPQGYELRATP